MRKTALSFIASMLLGCIAMAQGTDVTVIGRVEQNIYDSGAWENYWGNSGIYTFADGSITDRLSFSFGAHLFGEGFQDYYKALGTNNLNALLNASLTYSFDNLSITLGKVNFPMGSFEYDEYDGMIHFPFASQTWNNFYSYMWGGIIGISPWENTSFELGITSSPFVDDIFESFGYSLKWTGEYGPLSTLWSISRGNTPFDCEYFAALGTKYDFDSSNLTLDTFLFKGYKEAYLTYNKSFNDKFEGILRGGLFTFGNGCSWMEGAGVHWYPLTDDDSLRVHFLACYNGLFETLELSFGATWNLEFHLGK